MIIVKFEDIDTWQKARLLTKGIYSRTRCGEFTRDRALCDQIRAASVSIMSNIAEGFERGGDREFRRFLTIAKGSCGEVRSHLYVALDQNYLPPSDFERLQSQATEIARMISGLMRYLTTSSLDRTPSKQAKCSPIPHEPQDGSAKDHLAPG